MNEVNPHLQQRLCEQKFLNDYQLVSGVKMHKENPDHFQIPPDVIKRHISPGQFVELRIDSPRFSIHEDAAEKCSCPSCHGALSKPILRHHHPASMLPLPEQNIPSRGWGEDFWVCISERCGGYLRGVVDNSLVETRLHGLKQGHEIVFHQDHILAVHDIHRLELVAGMDEVALKELAKWLSGNNRD